MSIEQELKLHILASSRSAVEQLLRTPDAETIHLHAIYFDTDDRALACAGIALRLRKEADTWVQTIKLPGTDALSKIEYNHVRPDATLDLSVYQGTPAEETFNQLKHVGTELTARFETDVQRHLSCQRSQHGLVELAYDVGVIRAASLELPVYELELELKTGQSRAIFELAASWQHELQFILDFRSKAERGDSLAAQVAALKARGLTPNHHELRQSFQDFKLWQPAVAPQQGNRTDVVVSSAQLKKDTQLYLELIARNAAVIAAIDRNDMATRIDLDCAAHLVALCQAIEQLQRLWSHFMELNSATDVTSSSDARFHQLHQQLSAYQQRLAQGSPATTELSHPSEQQAQSEAFALAASHELQQWLLKALAWSMVELTV